jgi:hypothetical protein
MGQILKLLEKISERPVNCFLPERFKSVSDPIIVSTNRATEATNASEIRPEKSCQLLTSDEPVALVSKKLATLKVQ